MSAFYIMKYVGSAGVGGGTLYIGKGIIVGIDVEGGKYEGKYVVDNGRMKGTVKMTAPAGGSQLITGQRVPGGAQFDLTFDFPSDSFADGSPQKMLGVGGLPIQVSFEKVRDMPALLISIWKRPCC